MKELYWPEFETTLKQKVRGHIAQSPAVFRLYRWRKLIETGRSVLDRTGYILTGTFLVLCVGGVSLLFFGASMATSNGSPIPFLSFFCTFISFAWAMLFRENLRNSSAHKGFHGLPICDQTFFDLIWKKYRPFQISLFVFFSIVLVYLLRDPIPSLSPKFLLAKILIGSSLAGLFLLTIQALTYWFVSNWTTFFIKTLLWIIILWVIFVLTVQLIQHPLDLQLVQMNSVELIGLITPGGWLGYAIWSGILKQNVWGFMTLVPVCLLILGGTNRFHQMRSTFTCDELNWLLPLGLFSSTKQAQSSPEQPAIETQVVLGELPPVEADIDLMAAQVRRTLFTPGFDLAKQGWVERLSARYLSQSEQQVLEFMAGGTKINDWTKLWKLGLTFATTTSLGLLCSPLAFEFWKYLTQNTPGKFAILFILLAMGVILGFLSLALCAVISILLFCCSPAAGYTLSGFRLYRTAEKTIPIYAVYPIGFWPMIRIQWKLSLIRLILSFPALVVLGIGINSVFNLSSGIGIELAVKMICVLMLILCLGMGDGFSRGTSCGFASLFETIHGIGILLSGCGITGLLYLIAAGSTGEFATVWLVTVSLMFLWLLAFGKLYNHGKVDLLRKAA